MSRAKLLVHPVRLRIVQSLLGGRELTTAQIRDELDDVSAATVYRQVATLVDAGILVVVAERKVRGTFERTFRVDEAALRLEPSDYSSLGPEDHSDAFLGFVASLLGGFERYLRHGDVDPVTDRMSYRTAALHLSEEEADRMVEGLRAVLLPLLDHEPSPERRRYLLSTVLFPVD